MKNLYDHILVNIDDLSQYHLEKLLKEHDLNCLCIFVKSKFPLIAIEEIKKSILEEYSLDSLV